MKSNSTTLSISEAFRAGCINPDFLPPVIRIPGDREFALVLSESEDFYYKITVDNCCCDQFRSGVRPCPHQTRVFWVYARRYYHEEREKRAKREQEECIKQEREERLRRERGESIKQEWEERLKRDREELERTKKRIRREREEREERLEHQLELYKQKFIEYAEIEREKRLKREREEPERKVREQEEREQRERIKKERKQKATFYDNNKKKPDKPVINFDHAEEDQDYYRDLYG